MTRTELWEASLAFWLQNQDAPGAAEMLDKLTTWLAEPSEGGENV